MWQFSQRCRPEVGSFNAQCRLVDAAKGGAMKAFFLAVMLTLTAMSGVAVTPDAAVAGGKPWTP
jgi:hypothetical protein